MFGNINFNNPSFSSKGRYQFIISSNSAQRLKNFQPIKKSYAHRSKIVHGARLKEIEIGKIHENLNELDELMMQLFRMVLKKQKLTGLLSMEDKDLEEEFNKLTLGDSSLRN